MAEVLSAAEGYHCTKVATEALPAEVMLDLKFWSGLPMETADIVFVSLTAETISRLCGTSQGMQVFTHVRNSLSSDGAALVGILSDGAAGDIVQAHQLELEGLLAYPFDGDTVRQVIQHAQTKNRRRKKQVARQDKIRQLCRNLNQKRRHLRTKVDLLCRDLVHSNLHLTKSLQEMQRLCEFQGSLTGEFDLGYMLHKSLKMIQNQIPESSTAFYLAAEKGFEAHLSGLWYDRADDIEELEKLFTETLIRKVTATHRHWLISDAGHCPELSAKNKKLLSGLSLLALPVLAEGELSGILIVYRQAGEPFTEGDMRTLELFLAPLGRAVRSTYLLKTHIGSV